MSSEIKQGITLVDLTEHVVCGRYHQATYPEDVELLEVIEVANTRLAHTRIEGGHPDGRIAVFSRFISQQELAKRTVLFDQDPESYLKQHLENL